MSGIYVYDGILVRKLNLATGAQVSRLKKSTLLSPFASWIKMGGPAVSRIPSATNQIFDVQVGPGFTFNPATVNITAGDTVRWTWAGSGHSVTSGPPCAADSQFCSLMIQTAPRELFLTQAPFISTLCGAWLLFLPLRSALRYWYDWRDQCFGWLRAIRIPAQISPASGSGWLAFIFRPMGSFMEWAAVAPMWQATSLPIRLNTILALTAGLPSRLLTLTRM